MMRWIATGLTALVLAVGHTAWANEAAPLADDPVVEKRLIAISAELRCLVCQNESLAGSRADLALDLRREIRTLIRANKTDNEILEFMVTRYGDFVLYRPPVKPVTWLLWFGPFALLVGALWGLFRMVRASSKVAVAPPLDEAQRAQAQALLQKSDPL